MLSQDKKGLSIMIGYVLLISIAIIISLIVYLFLKSYVPKDSLECAEGVSIFIKNSVYYCDEDSLEITIKNNGRFSIAGFFIHATNSTDQELATIDLSGNVSLGGQTYRNSVVYTPLSNFLTPAAPNEKTTTFDLEGFSTLYKIEIIPVRFEEIEGKTRFVSCSGSKVEKILSCWEACTPNCVGKECGSDGCGGTCGSCEVGYDCIDGTCESSMEFLQGIGIVSWWKFEGDATDEFGLNDGTIYGADCNVAGKDGLACYFQDGDDMMLLSPVIDLDSTWTISTWIKYPLEEVSHWRTLTRGFGYAGDHQIIVQEGTYNLGTYDNSGGTNFRDSGYDVDDLSAGWHHLVVVQDGTDIIYYIDNSQVGIVSNYISTTDLYAIGNYQGNNQEWGTIDELMIFDEDLSVSEIEQLYNLDLS